MLLFVIGFKLRLQMMKRLLMKAFNLNSRSVREFQIIEFTMTFCAGGY